MIKEFEENNPELVKDLTEKYSVMMSYKATLSEDESEFEFTYNNILLETIQYDDYITACRVITENGFPMKFVDEVLEIAKNDPASITYSQHHMTTVAASFEFLGLMDHSDDTSVDVEI